MKRKIPHKNVSTDQLAVMIKNGFETVDKKIDTLEERLDKKIDGVEERLDKKIDGVEERLTSKIDHLTRRVDAMADYNTRISRLERTVDSLQKHS